LPNILNPNPWAKHPKAKDYCPYLSTVIGTNGADMPVREEEQVKAMLETMGVASLADIDEAQAKLAAASENLQKSTQGDTQLQDSAVEQLLSDKLAGNKPAIQPVAGPREQGSGEHGHPTLEPAREMSVSTLVHLLGLPSAVQFSILEGRVEALSSRISAVLAKIDRLTNQMEATKTDTLIDRLEFQLSDIRTMLKKVVPGGNSSSSKLEAAKRGASDGRKPVVMTSAPVGKSSSPQDASGKRTNGEERGEKAAEQQLTPEEQAALDEKLKSDLQFQATEAARVRHDEPLENEKE
jgi:hypothetical protein